MILLLPNRAGADGEASAAGGTASRRSAARSAAGRSVPPRRSWPTARGSGPASATSIDGAYVGIDAATGAAFATWRDVGGPIGWPVGAGTLR